MLKNLIKTAVRHILKHFGYSVLNILGLTIGISSALFLIIYVADEKRGLIFTMFTILAILIACLGLFGLASHMVDQRTKEI